MNIYFSGIGGVGIGPLAEIALDAGYEIAGSDPQETPMTLELSNKGVIITTVQDGQFMKDRNAEGPIDWFIYTSALPDNHPELMLARKLGIRTGKRDELIAYIINDKKLKLIAIAGTHGKTTTTSMMVWTLQQLGIPVSYSIGTTITFGSSGKFDPSSEYFVYECDEFDRNFLHFNPHLSLIASIDYDHPDTYPTENEYFEAFRQFVGQSERTIAWGDQHGELFNDLPGTRLLSESELNNLPIPGQHNRRNATLVQMALKSIGLAQPTDEIIVNFPGANRRFEKIAENLYSDYGHHPIEIAATLQLAREISDHVVLVYQPHQNIRQHEIRSQYINQFELAEKIYWLPTYLSREDPKLLTLKPEELIQNVTNKSQIIVADFDDSMWNNIQEERQKGNLVLCMGAGEIDNWLRKNLAETN